MFAIIVHFRIQKLKNKQTFTQTEKAKSSHFDRTRGGKNQIFPTIVITRWNDEKSRMFLRKTILGSAQHYVITNVKLLFVFGIPKNAKESDRDNILNEQEQYHDMIIPGES